MNTIIVATIITSLIGAYHLFFYYNLKNAELYPDDYSTAEDEEYRPRR